MKASNAVLQIAPAAAAVELGLQRSGRAGPRPNKVSVPGAGFVDDGHLGYYVSCGGGRKKEEKKRAKMVKGLEKDLSAFYSMGFGIGRADGLAGDVKNKMITEAAELLLRQLRRLRAEEKEMKRRRKEEKAAMKAARMKDCGNCESSGSSSESSDSKCEKTVVQMSSLRTVATVELKPEEFNILPATMESKIEEVVEQYSSALKPAEECTDTTVVIVKPPLMDKIEVCMGGKCKKSGAMELIGEFEKRVGIEGAVVGCKCMGKCRDGPNVRVQNQNEARNPLCIGVALEDVDNIVACFFGEGSGLLPT